MSGQERQPSAREKVAKMIADGTMAAYDKATEVVDELMPKNAPRTRFVVKQIRKAPGRVLDVVEVATAKDKVRAGVGVAGGMIGGAAGGALGGATGPAAPVAAPLGAAVGKVAGQEVALELYDDHNQAVRRAIRGKQEDVRRGIAQTKAWIKEREAGLARNAGVMLAPYLPPPLGGRR